MDLDRKSFLKLLAAGGASFLGLGAQAMAATAMRGSRVKWGRVKFRCIGGDTDDWNVHPHGDMNLMDAVIDQTTVNLDKQWNVAAIDKVAELSRYPFLFMHAELPPELDDKARKNLREYLLRGGFLFAEDCVIGKMNLGTNPRNDRFFLTMAEELPRIVPEAKFERLPNDHPVFHSLYHMPAGLPHMQGTPHGGWGLTLRGRLLAFLSPSDLHCGWTNGDQWFGAGQQELALKMGANLYVHAMTQTVAAG